MAPLQNAIEAFCFQQKPRLDVSGCQLYYQKKLLDPTTPVRFANLPKEAKLELNVSTGTTVFDSISSLSMPLCSTLDAYFPDTTLHHTFVCVLVAEVCSCLEVALFHLA